MAKFCVPAFIPRTEPEMRKLLNKSRKILEAGTSNSQQGRSDKSSVRTFLSRFPKLFFGIRWRKSRRRCHWPTHTQQFWEYMSLCDVHIQHICLWPVLLSKDCAQPVSRADAWRDETWRGAGSSLDLSRGFLVSYQIWCLHDMKCGFLDHFNSCPVFSSLPNHWKL